MIKYILRKILFEDNKAYGKYYAYPVVEQMVDLNALSQHMSEHNTPFSAGTIKGVLTDMVKCIKELLLEGRSVRVDDLAVFSLGIVNGEGADTPEDFSVSKNIKGLKLRAQGSGELIAKNLSGTFRRITYTTTMAADGTDPDNGGDSDGGSTDNSGSTDSGNGGSTENPSAGGSFTIQARVGADGGGSVTIKKNGTAVAGNSVEATGSDTVVIQAVPENDNFQFMSWSDGSSQNPRTIQPSADMNLEASFRRGADPASARRHRRLGADALRPAPRPLRHTPRCGWILREDERPHQEVRCKM